MYCELSINITDFTTENCFFFMICHPILSFQKQGNRTISRPAGHLIVPVIYWLVKDFPSSKKHIIFFKMDCFEILKNTHGTKIWISFKSVLYFKSKYFSKLFLKLQIFWHLVHTDDIEFQIKTALLKKRPKLKDKAAINLKTYFCLFPNKKKIIINCNILILVMYTPEKTLQNVIRK